MKTKNQQYSFQSVWRIPATHERVWKAMTATPFSWDEWWPQLHDLTITNVTPGLQGTTFSCNWQAPFGYKLHCDITITEVTGADRVSLHVEGDLWGNVTCVLSETAGTTKVDVDWQVQTTRPWMNRLTPLLRPFFVWGHHFVMRAGERGLKRYLHSQTN